MFSAADFWKYLFYGPILHGAVVTLYLAIACQSLAIVLGIVVAFARISRSRIGFLRRLSGYYIWFFRGVPPLVLIIFVYDAVPELTNHVIIFGPIVSAGLALSLYETAYMAEIIRAGINSVDHGQVEAAKAIGFTHAKTMWRVVLPQAVRLVIPPTGNEFISMLKNTSLAMVIATPELLYNVAEVYSANFRFFELLSVACVWYLAMTTLATYVQHKLEERVQYGNFPKRVGTKGLSRA
jgi:polar amino acid transport system permease protein